MRLQNRSESTVTDYVTGQQAEPGDIITVDDELAEHYDRHPVWDVLPDATLKKSRSKSTDTTSEGDKS